MVSVHVFPSPNGELHFSMKDRETVNDNPSASFRPLTGSYISQYPVVNEKERKTKFPSPNGELHFSIWLNTRDNRLCTSDEVSVP